MSYTQYGTVQASDFNTLVGSSPTTAANTLNTVWATGGGSAGYGQTPISTVSAGTTVAASSQWSNLITYTSNAAAHQATSIPSVVAPTAGNTISYVTSIPTNLVSIYNNRLNAASQGATTSNTATFGTAWSNALTFTFTATFANGDAARYFFNSGGQIKISTTHPSGTGIDQLFNNLASNIGNVFLSAPSSGVATIGGVSYNGVTKINGGGNLPTISTNSGYYGLTSSNTTIFTQTASTGPSGYLASNITIVAKTNGTQGTHSDNGNVITIYVVWDEVPNGLSASAGSATTMTMVFPETTILSNTWGSSTITGAVAGS